MKTTTAVIMSAILAASALAGTATWIGGDQLTGTDGDTFAVAGNWDPSGVPANIASTNVVIDQDGAGVRWKSGGSSQTTYYNPVVIGSDADPHVTVVLIPGRNANNPRNSDPGIHYFSNGIVITGANTRVVVNLGAGLHHNGSLTLDPRSTLAGEGLFRVSEKLTIQGRDYDALVLAVGRNSATDTYTLEGDTLTTGEMWLTATDRGRGVDSVVILDMAGNDLSVDSVRFGRLDWQTGIDGNQSGFGAIVLNGGVLSVSGDIFSLADGWGVGNDGTTALARQDYISGGSAGGSIRLGGSLSAATHAAGDSWNVENVDLVLCGDGSSAQEIEAMSLDNGDTETCCLANVAWQSITVSADASAKLVDNLRNASPSAAQEAFYVGDLVVESGATLDLNGINLYYYGTATIDGTVTGGTPRKLMKTGGVMRLTTFVFETPGTSSDGRWVGAMAVGTLAGESRPTLFVNTADKGSGSEPNRLHALQMAGGVLSERANYPVNANTVLGAVNNAGTANKFLNFIVADLGDGAGANLVFNSGGYSSVGRIGAAGTVESLCANRQITYGTAGYALADFDRDGVKEIAAFGRGSAGCVHLVKSGAVSWSRNTVSGGGPLSSGGVGSLDGDRIPELFSIGLGVCAFTAAGEKYTSPRGTLVENLVATNASGAALLSGEDFGGATAADLTGDGVPEFIFTDAKSGNNSTLKVMTQDGATLFSALGAHGLYALFDHDGDGDYEVLFGRNLYDGDGTILATLPIPSPALGFCIPMPPVLADLNGDEIPEAVYVCTSDAAGTLGRYVTAYDFAKGRTVPGFPVALKAELADNVSDSLWKAGSFTYWSSSQILVADLDLDGSWEIIVGVGIYDRNNSAGSVSPATLNVIRTPYVVRADAKRTVEDLGWYSLKKNPLMNSTFPLRRKKHTVIYLR